MLLIDFNVLYEKSLYFSPVSSDWGFWAYLLVLPVAERLGRICRKPPMAFPENINGLAFDQYAKCIDSLSGRLEFLISQTVLFYIKETKKLYRTIISKYG